MSKFQGYPISYLQFINKMLEGSEEYELFDLAINHNCTNIVNLLLKISNNNYLHINRLNSQGEAPLHVAIRNSSIDIIELLLKQPNININQLNARGDNALYLTIYYNSDNQPTQLKIIELLISNKLDINLLNSKHITTLEFLLNKIIDDYKQSKLSNYYKNAISTQIELEYNLKLVKKLLDTGANFNNFSNESILFKLISVLNPYPEIMELLILSGANININNENNDTLLNVAIINKHNNIVNLLLKYNININIINKDLDTALHLAIKTCNYPTISHLINDHIIKLDINNTNDDTPIILAIKELVKGNTNMLEVIKSLIKAGNDFSTPSKNSKFIIHYVLDMTLTNDLTHLPKLVDTILDCKVNINELDEEGKLPLAKVIEKINIAKEYRDIALALIKAGSEVNFYINDITPLHLAVKHQCMPLLKALLQHNVLVNVEDSSNNTPLHYAVKTDNIQIAATLLDANADITIPNKSGISPLALAICCANTAIVKLLFDKYENINKFDTGTTKNLDNTNTIDISEIVENSIKTNTLNHNLHQAIRDNKIELVKPLIIAKADLTATNHDGHNALFLAGVYNHLEIADLIWHYMNDEATLIANEYVHI